LVSVDKRGFRPDIQGMRAVAVAMVVVYHLWPSLLPGGFAGVDVFFVISGFLITGHLLREYRKTGRIGLVDFWGRRAKRLVPAAALVLTVTWLASRVVLPVTQLTDTASQIVASALDFQNWRLSWDAVDYLKADSAATPVQHFWSLSVEEQFYLGWPLLFLLAALIALTARPAARRARGHLVMLVLAGAVVACSAWYSAYYTHANPAGAYFVTTTRIWELGVGGLLALMPARVSGLIGRAGPLGWAGLGLVITSAFALSGTDAFPGVLAALPVGGAALLILGGSAAGRFGPSKLTSARPMIFLGGISYSLYLWHWPVIVLWTAWRGQAPGALSGLAIITVSVLLAWATKAWVEDPVRTARLLSGHRWRSAATALAAVVPVALAALFIVTQPGPWTGHLGTNYPGAAVLADPAVKAPRSVAFVPQPDQIKLPGYWQQGCLVETSAAPKTCVYGDTKDPTATVALVGDSFAGEWFPPLEQIAEQRHWKLVVETHAECPFSATLINNPPNVRVTGPYRECQQWGAAVEHELITTIHPDVVITSDLPGQGTPGYPSGGAAAQAEIGAGMSTYWKQLEAHGISVIAIKESPIPWISVPACVSKHPDTLSDCTIPLSKAMRLPLPTTYATKDAGGTVPLIDMTSLICAHNECPAVVGNVLVYQDDRHLDSVYTATMAPYLEQRLLAASKTLAHAR